MSKKSCVICHGELGVFSKKIQISDGVVCSDCLRENGISGLSNPQSYNTASLKELLDRRASIVSSFSPTKNVSTYIVIDENHKSFKIGEDIFEYSNLLSFELLVDNQSIQKGGIGRAVAGGLLFGGVGAVVGGITGRKSKNVCNSMMLRITLKNAHLDNTYIVFFSGKEYKTKGLVYRAAQANAQACISALEIIIEENQSSMVKNGTVQSSISVADEIIKLKQLLDMGAITQEEFDIEKKKLLEQ